MATGGVADPEELYSFELFECSVSLYPLMTREPRLLTCGHTFCTPCLKGLKGVGKGNVICCPKCRAPTNIPPGGVEAMAKNTDLGKMLDRQQQITSRIENYCQICKIKNTKVKFICITCSNKLICEKCAERHKKIAAFKSHIIHPVAKEKDFKNDSNLCPDHADILAYFCVECDIPLCCVCTCDVVHDEHPEKIIDLAVQGEKVHKIIEQSKDQLNIHSMDSYKHVQKLEDEIAITEEERMKINNDITCLAERIKQLQTSKSQMEQKEQYMKHKHEDLNDRHTQLLNYIDKISALQKATDHCKTLGTIDLLTYVKEHSEQMKLLMEMCPY